MPRTLALEYSHNDVGRGWGGSEKVSGIMWKGLDSGRVKYNWDCGSGRGFGRYCLWRGNGLQNRLDCLIIRLFVSAVLTGGARNCDNWFSRHLIKRLGRQDFLCLVN